MSQGGIGQGGPPCTRADAGAETSKTIVGIKSSIEAKRIILFDIIIYDLKL